MKIISERSISGVLAVGSVGIAAIVLLAQLSSGLDAILTGSGDAFSAQRFGLLALGLLGVVIGSASSIAYAYALWSSREALQEISRGDTLSVKALEGMVRVGTCLLAGGAIQFATTTFFDIAGSKPVQLDGLAVCMIGAIITVFSKHLVRQAEERYLEEI